MIEKRTVSIHVGASRVATDVVESVSNGLVHSLARVSTGILSQKDYERHFRTAVNATSSIGLSQKTVELQLIAMKQIDRFKHSVISQHAMLGSTKELFSKRVVFPKAKRRTQNLARTFDGYQVNLHLAIAPQSDCLALVLADDKHVPNPAAGSAPFHPWSDLVSAIASGFPQAHLTVWDFEQPEVMVVPFLAGLLGLEIDDVDIQTKTKLDIDACRHLARAKILSAVVNIGDQLQSRMDDRYERDLLAIDAMPQVSLVRGSMIMH